MWRPCRSGSTPKCNVLILWQVLRRYLICHCSSRLWKGKFCCLGNVPTLSVMGLLRTYLGNVFSLILDWVSEIHLSNLTRAWPGGGRLTPPLPNIRDSSKTNSAIDVKLGRPSHTTIWHRPWKFFWNPSENFWDMDDFVTSLHATFGRKLAKLRGSVEDAVFNENANEKHQKT